MKEWLRKSRYIRLGVTLFCSAAAVLLFYEIISDFAAVTSLLSAALKVLMPVLVGLTLAYILSPVYDIVARGSRWLFGKTALSEKTVTSMSAITASCASVLVIVGVVGGLISLVIPQLYASVINLADTFSQKQAMFEEWLAQTGGSFGSEGVTGSLVEIVHTVTDAAHRWANEVLMPNLANVAMRGMGYVAGLIGTVFNVMVGVIICVYVLNSKRLFAAQAKKVTYAVWSTPTANYILHMTRYIDRTFGRFINGMLLDAFMVGILCFAGMSLLNIPYALLVSAVVGVLNVVPVFGPIIAAAIGALFVLLDAPVKAPVFLVFVLVLQQIDGNIIAPKILGDKTGLQGFWVIFAITVGGGLFGFIGMILGVPTFAVIYTIIRQKVVMRLVDRQMPSHTEAYEGLWEIDERSGEPRYEDPVTRETHPAS